MVTIHRQHAARAHTTTGPEPVLHHQPALACSSSSSSSSGETSDTSKETAVPTSFGNEMPVTTRRHASSSSSSAGTVAAGDSLSGTPTRRTLPPNPYDGFSTDDEEEGEEERGDSSTLHGTNSSPASTQRGSVAMETKTRNPDKPVTTRSRRKSSDLSSSPPPSSPRRTTRSAASAAAASAEEAEAAEAEAVETADRGNKKKAPRGGGTSSQAADAADDVSARPTERDPSSSSSSSPPRRPAAATETLSTPAAAAAAESANANGDRTTAGAGGTRTPLVMAARRSDVVPFWLERQAAVVESDRQKWVARVMDLLRRHSRTAQLKRARQWQARGHTPASAAQRFGRTYLTPILRPPEYNRQVMEESVWRTGSDPRPRLVVTGYDGNRTKGSHDPVTNRPAAWFFGSVQGFCETNGIPHAYLGNVKDAFTNLLTPPGLPKGHRKVVVGLVLVDAVDGCESLLAEIVKESAIRSPFNDPDSSASATSTERTTKESAATVTAPTTQNSPTRPPPQPTTSRGSSYAASDATPTKQNHSSRPLPPQQQQQRQSSSHGFTPSAQNPPPRPPAPQPQKPQLASTHGPSTSAQSRSYGPPPPPHQKPSPPPPPQQLPSALGSPTATSALTMTKKQRKRARKRELERLSAIANENQESAEFLDGENALSLPNTSLLTSSSPSSAPHKKARLDSMPPTAPPPPPPPPPSTLPSRSDGPDDPDDQSRSMPSSSATNHASTSLPLNGLAYGMGGQKPTFPAGRIDLPALRVHEIESGNSNPTLAASIESLPSRLPSGRLHGRSANIASTALTNRPSSSAPNGETSRSENGELQHQDDSMSNGTHDQHDVPASSQQSSDVNASGVTTEGMRATVERNGLAPDRSELEGVMLEESVKVLDAALSCISARDKAVGQTLKAAEAKLVTLQRTRLALEQRKRKLKVTSLRQSSLQRKVSQSLAKSRGSLARLLSSEMTEQEIADLVAVEENAKREVTLERMTVESEGNTNVPTSENEGNLPVVPTIQLRHEPSMSLYKDEETLHPSLPTGAVVPLHEMQPKALLSFWSDRNFQAKTAGFFPCLPSKHVVRSVLDIACREMLALDHNYFPDARNRTEALRNTCLDARLLSPAPVEWKWRIASAVAVGSQSPEPQIDPSIALCPYELAGVCADPFCPYQHLEKRPVGTMIPREYLVLQTPWTNATNITNTTSCTPTISDGTKSRQTRIDSVHRGTNDVVTNADVVRLPAVEDDDDIEGESAVSVEEAFSGHTFYWWNQHAPLTTPSDARPSVFDKLRDFGLEVSAGSFSTSSPSDILAGCMFCGKVVEAIGVSLHSGRYDVASSMLEFASDIVDGWDNNTEVALLLSRVGLETLSFIKDVQMAAFAFDSIENKSSIRVAAESQMGTAFASFVLFLLFERIREGEGKSLHPKAHDWESDLACLSLMFEGFKSPDDRVSILEDLNHRALSDALRVLLSLFRDVAIVPEIPADVTNVQLLIESFIQPAVENAKHLLQTISSDGSVLDNYLSHLRVVCQMVNVIIRSLEWTIDYLADVLEERIVKGELTLLQDAFKARFKWLEQITDWNSAFDLILSPVAAACVSLLSTNQLYDKAQGFLVRLLAPKSGGKESASHRLFHLSEYLWSQLLQLRMALPPFSRSSNLNHLPHFKLPSVVADTNKYLAQTIDELNVHPHHVCLHGDWNLVRRASQLGSDDVRLLSPFRELLLSLHNTLQLRLTLRDFPLQSRRTGTEAFGASAIPHALFLAGQSMVDLDLTSCSLTSLPFHFGKYFPALEVLHLGLNSIKELPSSISSAQSLVVLNVDSNDLEKLPHQFRLPKLRELSLEDNKLSSLPDSLRECTELQVLKLRGNEFMTYDYASLATTLPKLHRLTVDSVAQPFSQSPASEIPI